MKKYFLSLTLFLSAAVSYAQWEPDVQLTTNAYKDLGSFNNSKWIASQGSDAHIVWAAGFTDGNALDVWHIRSINDGATWGGSQAISGIGNDEWYPSIALDGNVIHVVWSDSRANWEIYYRRSTNGGTIWEGEKRLTDNVDESTYPSIAASGSSVHVVWSEDDAVYDNWVYYKRSTNGGVDWQGTSRLSNIESASEVYPSISVSGTNIHVVWTENEEIYYRQSLDNGANWNPIVRLTNDPALSESPCISASGQDIHVAWQDRRDTSWNWEHWGIYYKRSTDGGSSWGEDKLLTNTPASSYTPSLTASGTVVHVVWEDNIDGNPEIYYKRSTNRGESWETNIRLTNNSAGSFKPSVAVSGLVVHVVWEDYRDDLNEDYPNIYYKRNLTGNVTGIEDIGLEFPEEFRLKQNYPNPFNPSTKISWQSPVGSWQTLKVYDVLGNEVATLVDEYKTAGSYEVEFQSAVGNSSSTGVPLGLASGVYYYQLRIGDLIQTKKMVLLR